MKYIVLNKDGASIIVMSEHDNEKDAEIDIELDMAMWGTKREDYKIVTW